MAVKIMDINENVKESVLVYSININARSFPDVRDGLKPVAKRIIYAMYASHVTSDKPRKKGNTVCGFTMQYHAHGRWTM